MSRRAGLSPDRVLDAALQLVEQAGLDALTLAALAARLGVRPPSLYKHVASLDDVRANVIARGIGLLAGALEQAAMGRARDDAARALGATWRRFGREHPRLLAAMPASHIDQPPVVLTQLDRLGRVVFAVFAGYGLAGEDLIHVIRAFRSAVHGFVQLESAGGFAMDADPDVSFDWLLDSLLAGFAARTPADPAQRPDA